MRVVGYDSRSRERSAPGLHIIPLQMPMTERNGDMCLALAIVIPRIQLVGSRREPWMPKPCTTLVLAVQRKLQSSPALPRLRLTGSKTKSSPNKYDCRVFGLAFDPDLVLTLSKAFFISQIALALIPTSATKLPLVSCNQTASPITPGYRGAIVPRHRIRPYSQELQEQAKWVIAIWTTEVCTGHGPGWGIGGGFQMRKDQEFNSLA